MKKYSGKRVIFRGFSVLYVKGETFNQTKPIMYEITYVNLSIQSIGMNWCPTTDVNNNIWYTLTGNWQVTNMNNTNSNFTGSRKMLYNFRTTN